MANFPVHPDQLSAQWLTGMLRASGALGGDRSVDAFEVTPVGSGTGLLGMVMRIHLQYDGGAAGPEPASLVVKFSHPVEANRAIAMNTNMYAREVAFFHDIAGSVDVPKPVCHFAAVEGDQNIVVLEDLGTYRAGDQVAGVSPDEVKLVIDAIAPLHAAYWGRCDTPELANFMRIDSSYAEKFPPSVHATWQNCVDVFPDAIADDVLPHVERYVEQLTALHSLMGKRTQTVVHGDVRLDNVMFGGGPGQHPVSMVDWQAIMVSNPLHDLAYLLSQSLDVELRRAHEADLIAYYHAKLVELGVADVTLQECIDGYDVGVLFLFSYPLIIGGFCDMDDPRAIELARAVLHRSSATVSDRGLLRLLD
jgi:aminoglycoside/choline kinase family phosphotransferase